MAKHAAGTDAAADAVLVAIDAVTQADPAGWQRAVALACELDQDGADLAARAELARRVREQGIEAGMVVPICNGAQALAAAAEDGPFECPAHLFELAIRRALDEPGCVDHVDIRELIFASTQCSGMLDVHDALLPPGWGWAIHLPLP
ncbi:MAG: hypothetical protein ABI140_04000 [Jatrophihabitantaceae bacterium]